MLEARGISWREERRQQILHPTSLTIGRGEWISLIGPNGSGKSTLLQLLAGIRGFSPDNFEGAITWTEDGLGTTNWPGLPARARASRVAYLGSELESLFPVTAGEVVASGAFASGGTDRIPEAIRFCELGGLESRDLRTLSGGERQRVVLARALVQGARVLLLDESLSKMDIDYQFELGDRLRSLTEGGLSVVLVSHDPQLGLRQAGRVWLLKDGKMVADGAPADVLVEDRLREVFPRSDLWRLLLRGQK